MRNCCGLSTTFHLVGNSSKAVSTPRDASSAESLISLHEEGNHNPEMKNLIIDAERKSDMEAISEKIIKHFKYLGLYGARAEEKIREVLESEYRRRLTRYEHTDRLFRKKYGMTFDEFERAEIVKTKDYAWEVESDSDEWEMALDGVESMKRGLKELLGERFDA
jgi:hypothetical protein